MPLAQIFSKVCPMSPVTARSASPLRARTSPDKDQPLIDDIRFLGRLLGDVIREQEGQAAFDLIEQVRRLSVAFRRHADAAADQSLKKLLKSLSADQTVSVIRAFTSPISPKTGTTSVGVPYMSVRATCRMAAWR